MRHLQTIVYKARQITYGKRQTVGTVLSIAPQVKFALTTTVIVNTFTMGIKDYDYELGIIYSLNCVVYSPVFAAELN